MEKDLKDLNNVVIYGAGVRGGVILGILKEQGCQPVAFCDANPQKIGTVHLGLPVLAKNELRTKYGEDFWIFVSPNFPLRVECQEQLLAEGIVTKDKIINYWPYEKFLGCYSLNHVCIATTEGLYICCLLGEDLRNRSPMIPWQDSVEETVDKFLAMRQKLIEDVRAGKECVCSRCHELRNDYWNIESKIEVLAISPSYPCQLGCIYCDVQSNSRFKNKEIRIATDKINVIKFMEYLEAKDQISLKEPIQISAGEISINPKKREILNSVSKYPLQIFSNCVVYDEQISELIARDGSFLNVSLDAGNRETYKKVKGLDAWSKVTENISRYQEEGANIEIKYILLPENCDEDNINGFIDFCKNTKIKRINVSCNVSVDHSKLPKEIVKAAIYMAKAGEAYGADVEILPYFGDKNMAYIMRELGREQTNKGVM